MISRNNTNKLKCRISDTDGFKTIQYLEDNLSDINDSDFIILVCDENHINKYALVKDNQNNRTTFKIEEEWYDIELKQLYQLFNLIRTSIPDIDRERFLDFFSFCNLGDGHVYAAAVSVRVILEDFLIDIYSKPLLSYMESNYRDYYISFFHRFNNSTHNTNMQRALYADMNTTDMIEKIEIIDSRTYVKENNHKSRNTNYILILRNYLNSVNRSELRFDHDDKALSNLWETSSGIVHGKQFTMEQLIGDVYQFLKAMQKHLNEGLKWER